MGLLTEELESGLTASVVELIVMGRGADVLRALGQLERGAVLGGEADAILESAAHICRSNEKPTMADLMTDIAQRFSQPESIKAYLFEKAGGGTTSPDPARICQEFADQINQRFQQEQIAINATTLAAEARQGNAVLADLRRMVDDLEATAESSTCISWSQAVEQLLTTDADQFIPTNHQWFDQPFGGLPIGLTILAGNPGTGKSALALQLALGAVTDGAKLLWAMGEMRPVDLVRRSMAVMPLLPLGANLPKYYMGRDENKEAAAQKVAEFFGTQAHIETNFTLDAIEAGIIQHKPSVVVVDYIQLLRGDEASRVEQLDSISIRLIEMARRHEVALVAISSMAKGSDGKSSIGSISRGTASLDYSADLYFLAEAGDSQDAERSVKWCCKKNRRGGMVDLDLIFDGLRQYSRSAMAAAVDESLTFSGEFSGLED
jgi:KaiC/GvpD/RAD55 family RecA-like ATPase